MNHTEYQESFTRQKAYVESMVSAAIAQHQLHDWSFSWDHARRRLGSCRYQDKQITLSKYFVAYNEGNLEQIKDTILHEIAHVLAWVNHQERGHGKHWKHYCSLIGATPRAVARHRDIASIPHKYHVILKNTGEIVGRYYRRPRFARNIKNIMLRGKPETRGMLELVPAHETPQGAQ